MKYTSAVDQVIKFKSGISPSSRDSDQRARLIDADSVALDSAIWVLEAALNYDFDQNLEGAFEYHRIDTLHMQVGVNGINMKISSDELEDAYLSFYEQIHDSLGSDFQVEYIDVSGYVPDPTDSWALLDVVIIKYATSYPVDCPTSGPFNPTASYKPMTNVQWGVIASPCGSNPWPEATSALNVYMNCRGISHECPLPLRRPFYVDIVTFVNPFDANQNQTCLTNPYSTALYHSCYQANYNFPNWWCNLSNHSLSGMQLNSYLLNQISLANGLVLSPWEVISRQIVSNYYAQSYFVTSCNCFLLFPGIVWSMNVATGRFICSDPIE